MFNNLKKKNTQVGIDVGASFIKAVVIDKAKTVPELSAFSYVPATSDRISSLKKAISELQISNVGVNTSIAGPSTIVRIIEMPNMTEKELKSAVKFEAEKYIPYKLDEVVTDCVKIGQSSSGKIDVLLVAARKTAVNNCIELFQKAGLTLHAIDIDSFAVMNAFLHSQKEDQDMTCALINIGAKTTNINIVREKQSYLARDIQMGGEDITVAIKERFNIERDEAEGLKINPGKDKDEIMAIGRNIFFKILDEIRFSFDFYENHYGKGINKIFVSGGSGKLEGLSDYIKDIFSGDIVFWNPFNNINISSKINTEVLEPIKSSFAVAVGLGLRED